MYFYITLHARMHIHMVEKKIIGGDYVGFEIVDAHNEVGAAAAGV